MAANYITIGSKFQPFSFAEMIQPLQIYGQEYQRQEDLYNNYAETAGLIGSDLSEAYDADIIDNIYNPYMKDLNAAASALSEKGLSPESRKNLQELRRRFGREITPIKMASEARAKARDNWDKMLASDKSLMTNANPYYLGVSSYMNGKSPETAYVSGNELYQRGKNLSEAFSKTMRSVPSDRRSVLQGQYWEIAKQFGANSEEMNQFMQGVIESIPALGEQVDDIMNASGIYQDGFTSQDRDKAYQYIVEGMKAGLSGTTDVQYLSNKEWDLLGRGSRRGSGKDTPPASLPTFTIGLGHSGNGSDFNRTREFIKTLVGDGSKVSSIELDRLIQQYSKDLSTLKEFEDKYGKYTEIKPDFYKSLETPGMTSLSNAMNSSVLETAGFANENGFTSLYSLDNDDYNRYTKARQHLYGKSAFGKSVYEQMQELQTKIDDLVKKYGHLPGKDIIESIEKGVALDEAHATQEHIGIVPRVTPTEQKNAVASILNGIGYSMGESGKSKTKGIIDTETGKQLSNKEIDKLLEYNNEDDRIQLVSSESDPIVLYDKKTKKSYSLFGSIYEIDDYKKRFNSQNSFLKDFSNSENGISEASAEISDIGLSMLYNYGVMPSSGGVNLGDDYKGFYTYTNDGDIMKVVVKEDSNTGLATIVGVSSLNDEISKSNRGEYRGKYIKDAATGFLTDIFVINQAK